MLSAAVVISTSLVFEGALSIGSAQIIIELAILLIPRESNCLYKCSISMVERDSHSDVTGWICYLFLFPKLWRKGCFHFRIWTRTQLFKTNNVISKHIVKTLIIKYGIYANIFDEKCEWLLYLQKLLPFDSKNTCELDIVLTRTV